MENLQSRTACLSLAFLEPFSPPCRHGSAGPWGAPRGDSAAGRWGCYLCAMMAAICNADAPSLRMPRGHSYCPGRGRGGEPVCSVGSGGACQALPDSPEHTAEGRARTTFPRPSGRDALTPPRHLRATLALPRSLDTLGVPSPCNQRTFNMTMAMTIPSSQGQAREDLKPPPTPSPRIGVPVRRPPAVSTITSPHPCSGSGDPARP